MKCRIAGQRGAGGREDGRDERDDGDRTRDAEGQLRRRGTGDRAECGAGDGAGGQHAGDRADRAGAAFGGDVAGQPCHRRRPADAAADALQQAREDDQLAGLREREQRGRGEEERGTDKHDAAGAEAPGQPAGRRGGQQEGDGIAC